MLPSLPKGTLTETEDALQRIATALERLVELTESDLELTNEETDEE